jgi:hypothetical protein
LVEQRRYARSDGGNEDAMFLLERVG